MATRASPRLLVIDWTPLNHHQILEGGFQLPLQFVRTLLVPYPTGYELFLTIQSEGGGHEERGTI